MRETKTSRVHFWFSGKFLKRISKRKGIDFVENVPWIKWIFL
jgi:hypothetical protein